MSNLDGRIILTTKFLAGIKTLQRQHKNIEIEKLNKIINDLEHERVTTAYDNHALGGKTKLNDIHINGDTVLLYRYETDEELEQNILIVSLRLDNITNHQKLQQDKSQLQQVATIVKPPLKIKNKSLKR